MPKTLDSTLVNDPRKANRAALIIDPNAAMRKILQEILVQCGITKIDHATNSTGAMRFLKENVYHLILSEHTLGDGQDGQQLLEDLRQNKIMPLWTLFIMVAAERNVSRVVSTTELAPNDYILKPFSADVLLDRIMAAFEKQDAILPVHQLIEQGRLRDAIAACSFGEIENYRYTVDYMRLRAELHMTLGEPGEAEVIYTQVLEEKAYAWAKLGLAKSLSMQHCFDEAKELLINLITENDRFMEAYDCLAKTYEASGELSQAKVVLEDAVNISPHAIRRLRKLGEVALEAGDMEMAEQAFHQVVTNAKHSEFRDPEDHVRLVKTLVKKDDPEQAMIVIDDLEKSWAGSKKASACRALSTALVHASTGDNARASEELAAAVEACRDSANLSNDMKMELAKNCLQHDLEKDASEVMLSVISNGANDALLVKAKNVLEAAGRKGLAERLANESRQQVNALILSGAEKAKEGDHEGAVTLMTEAARRLPNNSQVIYNAALAILKYLENVKWDDGLNKDIYSHLRTIRHLDPTNSRLALLSDLHKKIMKKYR